MAASLNSNSNACADSDLNNSCDTSYDTDRNADPFATENNGTARFIGTGGALGGLCSLGGASGTAAGSGSSLSELGAACPTGGSGKFDFHTMKAASNQKASRIELPRSELLKMLFYLEGELQARDVVIAALRNERVKHLITQLRANPISPNDPYAAIFRDKIALTGNLISRQSSTTAVQAEMEVRLIIEQQMESLYQMVHKQRATHVRMVGILTESLDNNQRMLQELEEEKRKHEHDTAQGDDITYGLEMERTKLRQELETERQQVKKLEKDLKKLQETLDFERGRQKQIVLLLIAERKKILMKYIEEGKRSEDLAQILSEEKQRSDSIAEGLEEESKKSLRMEAEIEKQAFTFDGERKTMKTTLAKDEKRIKDLEMEIAQLKSENEAFRKHCQQQLPQQQQSQNPAIAIASSSASAAGAATAIPLLRQQQSTQNVSVSNLPIKSRPLNEESCGSPMVNIAKIVQPTATVSSVPVSGPTTGIARSISPGQGLRSSSAATVTSGVAVALGSVLLNDSQTCCSINTSSCTNLPIAGSSAATAGPTTILSAISTTTSSLPLSVAPPAKALLQQQQQQQLLSSSASSSPSSASPSSSSSSSSAAAAAAALSSSPSPLLASASTSGSGFIQCGMITGASQLQPTSTMQRVNLTSTSMGKYTVTTTTNTNTPPVLPTAADLLLITVGSTQTQPTSFAGGASSSSSVLAAPPPMTLGQGVGGGGGAASQPASASASSPLPTAIGMPTQPARGLPPPIPPNKPVVPPKREPSIARLPSASSVVGSIASPSSTNSTTTGAGVGVSSTNLINK